MYRCIKRIIFLFFANMLFLNAAYNQAEWFPVGAEWYYERLRLGEYSTFRFYVEKDTVVDGKACRLVRGEHGNEIVYEENGNVYYYFNKNFRKIFAFNVNVGDTVEFEFKTKKETGSSDLDTVIIVPCRIESISAKIIDGMELKEIYAFYKYHEDNVHGMHDHFQYKYLEKAGVEYNHIMEGIFPVMPNYATVAEGHYKMRCYNDFQINWQSTAGDKPCDYAGPISINGGNNFHPDVELFPNPVKNILTVSGEKWNMHEVKVVIYNTMGEIVFEKDKCLPCEINVEYLVSGIYYIRIFDTAKDFISNNFIKL